MFNDRPTAKVRRRVLGQGASNHAQDKALSSVGLLGDLSMRLVVGVSTVIHG